MLSTEPKVLMAMVMEKMSPINRAKKEAKIQKMQPCNLNTPTDKADLKRETKDSKYVNDPSTT